MKTVKYSDGRSLLVPESPLEVDLIRQIILPDEWDLVSETPIESVSKFRILSWTMGGQVVFDSQWSSQLIIHYSVGEHLGNGRFNLIVTLYGET